MTFPGVRDITEKGISQHKDHEEFALDSQLSIINDGVSAAGIIKKEIIQPNGALSSENGCQYWAPDPVLASKKAVSLAETGSLNDFRRMSTQYLGVVPINMRNAPQAALATSLLPNVLEVLTSYTYTILCHIPPSLKIIAVRNRVRG